MKKFTGRILEKIDTFIRLNVDDEDLFMNWIQVVPDEATSEDFYDFAEDREFCVEMAETFLSIVFCENSISLDFDIYESILFEITSMMLESK